MKHIYKISILFCISVFIGFLPAYGQEGTLSLKLLDTYEAMNRGFDEGAAEIPAYDESTGLLFITNSQDDQIDVVRLLPNGTFEYVDAWVLASYWSESGGPNSVAAYNGLIAVAVENDDKQMNGAVLFLDTDGNLVANVTVGALPDMLTFTADGSKVLVANEGEPDDDYVVDPEGSVSIINTSDFSVRTADFSAFTDADALRAQGIRIFGPNATPAQDFEPEYIAVSADGKTAWVTLQENNALAVIDVEAATVSAVVPLGYKDHSLPGNRFDASNRDGGINLASWPVRGLYMPDAIASYQAGNGKTYLVTANEGDSRDYDGFGEEARIGDDDIILDPVAFPNGDFLKENRNLGRLKITNTLGDTDNDGDYDELYSFGARSFSIWSSDGRLVFDSRFEFEARLAELFPDDFNSSNDESPDFDGRSDDKGPEPEGVTIGEINGKTYAFIGLERIGGVMVYDITNPWSASYVTYINNRDFSREFNEDEPEEFINAGDLGPEGLQFVPAGKNPTGKNLLIVANEISGTTSVYSVEETIQDVSASAEGAFWTGKGTYRPVTWLDGRVQFEFSANADPKAGRVFGTARIAFKKGPMFFRKTSLESLSVNGNRTILTGFGTVNNEGSYKFMIDYTDSFNDKVRIIIWNLNDGSILYDSQFGDAVDAAPETIVGPFDAFFTPDGNAIVSSASDDLTLGTSRIEVYPNPATDYLNILVPGSGDEDALIRVIDSNGRSLYESRVTTGSSNRLDISGFRSGLLLVQIIGKDGQDTYRVVKN